MTSSGFLLVYQQAHGQNYLRSPNEATAVLKKQQIEMVEKLAAA